MEGDSQEEDETLRDYWTKKKEKKKEREKKRRERERGEVSRGKLRVKTRRHRANMKSSCLTSPSSPPSPLLTSTIFTP
jgi:hypothetical protein